MRPVLTAAESRDLDRVARERGIRTEDLMERAGRGVAAAALELCGGAYGRRLVAVCGKGNNGGDAIIAARVLSAAGMTATAILIGEPPGAAGLEAAGVRVGAATDLARELARADVVVDGIFGSGFRGGVEGPHAEAIEAINRSGALVVAVDVPSGVEGDTGAVRGPAVRADVTVTFGALKVGAVLFPGAARAGRVVVADIGFPGDLVRSDLLLTEADDVRSMLPRRSPDDHKHRSGDVLVVAGSRGMTGAPTLVAQGAYRAGAGLVHVAVPRGILSSVQPALAEAVWLPLPEGPEGALAAGAWDELAERAARCDAIAVGPGLTTTGETPELVRRLVSEAPAPLVIDADAINAFEGRPAELAERPGEAVLTPHEGEFSRLFAMPVSELAEERVGLVRKAAAEVRGVVALKGPRTLVALPDGRVRVNPTGSSALATGGTGDVLTGIVAAFLARGLAPEDAATAAAFVHGLAGEIAGRRSGEGTLASDVAAATPEAVAQVLGASS